MTPNLARSSLTLPFIIFCVPSMSFAANFLEKRICLLDFGDNRAPLHTRCIISGRMQGGIIDVSIRTPDGKTYALEGPIDGEEGNKFPFQKRPASNFHNNAMDESNCYKRVDQKLSICFGAISE